ncbi:MAG: DUF4055 domain-containing protein [bacterium]|nr:DUF4055 domain-containing protein [bacterium]
MRIQLKHPLYKKFEEIWETCRNCVSGELAVKEEGTEYLPKPAGMDGAEYHAYKLRARFYEAPERTLEGMLGQIFRKRPVLKNLTEPVQLGLQRITRRGGVTKLARDVVREVLSVGRVGLLVDLAPQERSGALAYVARYSAENILSWESYSYGGTERLTRLVLRESYWGPDPERPSEEYKKLERLRLLALDEEGRYYQQVHVKVQTEQGESWVGEAAVYPKVKGEYLGEIPFVFCGPGGGDADPEQPPLLKICLLALSYYRTSADLENALYFVGNPTPCATGVQAQDAQSLRMGSSAFNAFGSPEAKVFLLELKGTSVLELRENLNAKKEEMATLGLRMLEAPKKSSQSAENQQMLKEGEKSHLAVVAEACSEQLSEVLRLWSFMSGFAEPAPQISLNRDFSPGQMPVEDAVKLADLVDRGKYTLGDFAAALEAGELLPATATAQEFLGQLPQPSQEA